MASRSLARSSLSMAGRHGRRATRVLHGSGGGTGSGGKAGVAVLRVATGQRRQTLSEAGRWCYRVTRTVAAQLPAEPRWACRSEAPVSELTAVYSGCAWCAEASACVCVLEVGRHVPVVRRGRSTASSRLLRAAVPACTPTAHTLTAVEKLKRCRCRQEVSTHRAVHVAHRRQRPPTLVPVSAGYGWRRRGVGVAGHASRRAAPSAAVLCLVRRPPARQAWGGLPGWGPGREGRCKGKEDEGSAGHAVRAWPLGSAVSAEASSDGRRLRGCVCGVVWCGAVDCARRLLSAVTL